MSNDQNYRPRSPDLSGFGSHQPHHHHHQQHQPHQHQQQQQQQQQQQRHQPPPPRLDRLPSYQVQEPSLPKGYSFSPRGSYDASPFFSPTTQTQIPFFNSPYPPQPVDQQHQTFRPKSISGPSFSPPFNRLPPSLPQQVSDQFSPSRGGHPYPANQDQDDMARLRSRKPVNYNENQSQNGSAMFEEPTSYIPPAQPHHAPQPQFFPQQMQMQMQMQQVVQPPVQQQPPTNEPDLSAVDVKTKFPVARIKRIMQADEDVGKVAQATPTAVSKALELFMIALVSKGASEAKGANSKRVTATHLKQALLKDEKYDFLNEICEAAPDEGTKKRAKGEKSEHDDESDDDNHATGAGAAAGAKKKGRKKKKDAGTDSD